MQHRYLTKENAGSVIGKVMQTVQVVKTVQELKRHLLRKDGSLKPNAKIYYDAFIGSNARIYLRTEGFSTIQEDKLLRHLFVVDNPIHKPKTIKRGSFDELLLIQSLMVGLSEVKSLTSSTYKSEDKDTPEATYVEFHKVLARFKADKPLRGLVGRIKDNKLRKGDSALIAELVGGIKNYVAINALIGLHTYNLSEDNVNIEVTSESDGKNSAVGFALMSNSSNAPHLRVMLLSVGVITKEGLKAYAEELPADKKAALDILTANGYLPSQEELNNIHPIQDAYQAAAIKFINSIPPEGQSLIVALIGEELIDSNGNVTKAGRDFAKDPTMTYHYGRQAKAMAGGVGTNTTATFLEDILSSEDFNDEEKLSKLRKVIELSNTLIQKEITDIQTNSGKVNKRAEKVKEEVELLEKLLVKDVDAVLDRVKQKLLHNTSDEVISDVMLTIKDAVTGVLGFNMHKSLEETYEGLNKHEEVVNKGYNIAYAIKKAYSSYLDSTNADILVYAEVQKYLEQDLGITDNKFVIGESTNDQQLNIMKTQPNKNMYGEDGAGALISNGGNSIDFTRADGKVETIRVPRRETKNAITSLAPLGTHRRDTNVVHRVLEFLKVNQIYDAFVTSGRTRLLSEWLANLEFVRQTLFTPHEVTYAIRNLKELDKNLGKTQLNDNNEINKIVEQIMEDYHIRISIFGPNSKAKGQTIGNLSTALRRVIKSLEAQEARLDAQRAELFTSLTTVGQYGVVGTVEFTDGVLLGFRVRLGKTSKLVSLEDLGLAKDMSFDSEEDMVNISKALVEYVTKNDDLITTDIAEETTVTPTNIIKKLKDKIEDRETKRTATKKKNADLKKATPRKDVVSSEDLAGSDIEYMFEDTIPLEEEGIKAEDKPLSKEQQKKQDELDDDRAAFQEMMKEVNKDLGFNSIVGEIVGEEIESIENVNEDTIERIFNDYMEDPTLSTVDKLLARQVFDKYVLPLITVLHAKEFTSLNLTRVKLNEGPTSGHFVGDSGTDEYNVIVGEGTTEQSKAEVLNHELLHALFLAIIGSDAVDNVYSKEVKNIEKLHRKVARKATTSWFGDGDTAILQYDNVFKHKDPTKNLVEFSIYMMTNAIFRDNVNKHIGEVRTTNNQGLGIDGSKSTVYKAYNFIENLFFKILNMFKQSKTKDKPSKIIEALATKLLKAEKKEVSKSFASRVSELFSYMDAYVGRGTKPEKYVLPLISPQAKSMFVEKANKIKDGVTKNFDVEGLSDVSELGAFLHSTMKTPEKVLKYVEHFVKATSVLSTNKTGYIRKVVKSILSPNDSKKLVVGIGADEKLNNLLVEYDAAALWKIPEINFRRVMAIISNKHNNREIMKELLVGRMMLILQTGTKEDIGITQIEDIVTLITNAFDNNKKGTRKKTKGIINATKGINDLLYRAGLAPIVLNKENKKAYTTLLDYLDALATIEVLDRANQGTLDSLVDTALEYEDSSVNILNHMYNILNHTDSDLITYRSLKPKGKYRDLEDETESIMAVHRNKKGKITTKLPPIHKLIHTVSLPNGEGKLEYYKVKTSPLNTMHQGSLGYIDNSIFRDPSITAKDESALVDEILKDDYLGQFLLPVTGKEKTDIKMVIPSFLSRKHLDVDNRASARLGHIIGRIEEEKDATELNLDLLDIMEEDFTKNYSKNPEDFIFVSKGSRNSDLRKYYNLLPTKFHIALKKKKYNLAQTGGLWVRKNTLRYNFGSVGIGLSEVLTSYGITKEVVHKVIVTVEKALADLARFMKLEVAGKIWAVIGGNFISNVLLETLKGRNPVEVIRYTIEGMKYHYLLNKDLNSLIEVKESLDTMENKIVAEPTTTTDRRLRREYRALLKRRDKIEQAIKDSPVYYLHEAGFNSALKEDITSEESLYMSKNIKALRKKTPKALYQLGEQLYMGSKTDIGKVFSNLVSASDFGSRYATDQLDAKYFKAEVRKDFKALMKVNKVEGSTRLFKEYYTNRLQIFERERKVNLAKQHIIYGENGGKFLTAMDTLGPGAFYKFKQRINQVLIERYRDKPVSALIVGIFLAYVDSLGAMGNLLERPEESFSDFFSKMESMPTDMFGIVVSPPLLALLGITKD